MHNSTHRPSKDDIRNAWRATVVAGLLVVALAAVLMPMFPSQGAGYAPGYGEPVYAFEMARTRADLLAVFGASEDPARASRIAAMDRANYVDFGFAAAYGSFVALFFLAASRESEQRIWLLLTGLGITAGVADAVENMILLELTTDLDAALGLGVLAYPVWTKFWCLLAAGLAAGVFLISRGGGLWPLLGILAAAGASTVLAAFYSAETYGWLVGAGITVCWSIQLAYAVTAALRSNPEPAP